MKFIDKTIKRLLLAIGSTVTLIVVVYTLIIDCTTDTLSKITLCEDPSRWVTVFGIMLALLVGVSFAYTFVRVVFWPNGPKSKITYRIIWAISGILGCFVALVTFFVFALATFGLDG